MNRPHKKSLIGEYLATVVVSVVIIFACAFCVELELLFRCEQKINTEELKMENLSKFCTIEELEQTLLKEPNNYLAMIKLARIYTQLGNYKMANSYYSKALNVSARSNYSLYSYAIFCADRGFFALSATLCEELFGSNIKTMSYKANIYEKIGDNLDSRGQVEASLKAYQIAYKYAKNIQDDDYLDVIKEKYALEYIKLADVNVENKNMESAVLNLENAIKLKRIPTALYKLGLIYQNIDMLRAEKLLFEAFDKNPYIVNPYIYNSLLEKLITESKDNGNYGRVNYFSMKQNRYKKMLQKAYIYKGDVSIDNLFVKKIGGMFSKDKKYYIVFDIKNNTKQKINSLYLEMEIFIGKDVYKIERKIVSHARVLDVYDVIDDIKIELPPEIKFTYPKGKNNFIVKSFVKKREKAPWTLININALNY